MQDCCRSPRGERGLKFSQVGQELPELASLPARGAWIEISVSSLHMLHKAPSLPARGAWIEIRCALPIALGVKSLPARGAWIEMTELIATVACWSVAPREGSVD